MKWEYNGHNHVLEGSDFRISYLNMGDAVLHSLGWGVDEGHIGETALIKDGKYYILNGDHRKEYEVLVDQGFVACYNYFLSKPDEKSSWSN